MVAIPALATQSALGVAPAAWANSVRDAVAFFTTSRPHAILTANATQSIPDTTPTGILFAAETYDNDGGHSTSVNTGRYTVVTPGRYLVSGTTGHGASTAGSTRACGIFVNGTLAAGGSNESGPRPGGTGAFTQTSPTVTLIAAAADFIEMKVTQNSGGSLTNQANSVLHVLWIGA